MVPSLIGSEKGGSLGSWQTSWSYTKGPGNGTRQQLNKAGLDHVMGTASQASPAGRTLPVAGHDTGVVSAMFPLWLQYPTAHASRMEGGERMLLGTRNQY